MALPIRHAFAMSCRAKKYRNLLGWLLAVFLLLTIIDSVDLVNQALSRTRSDLFLVEEGDDLYQWPGDLLSNRVLLVTFLSGAWLVVFWRDVTLTYRLMRLLMYAVVGVQFAASFFVAQIIGSNKAVLIIAGCLFVFVWLFFWLRAQNSTLGNRCLFEGRFLTIFDSVAISSLVRAAFVFFLSAAILSGIAGYLDFPFEKFRIFGYGTGEISSFDSRLEIISKYFVSQFAVAPFFGHAGAERLIAGEMAYVHSMLLYSLTHTGAFGFLVFALSVIVALIEQSAREALEMASIGLLRVALFLVIFFVGIVSSSLVWGCFWFAFGFLLPPISLASNRGRCLRSCCLCKNSRLVHE